jgi:ribosome recycling factor
MDPVLQETFSKITSALDYLKIELSSIRAGRANPALIENVPVEAYGGKMKLNEVGTISAPQPSLLTVQIWDPSVIQSVVKSLQEANLGLNPSNDGATIRLPIPPLTEERRQEYIKLAHQKMEQARIEIRRIRQETRGDWERLKTSGEFGDDELSRRSKILQDLIDRNMDLVDQLGKQKTEELSQI